MSSSGPSKGHSHKKGSKARAEPKPTSSNQKARATASSSDRKLPNRAASSNDNTIFRVNFEIRGKVQGVHFRKFTQMKGTSFGLRGWCQNTDYSTVIGCMEGPRMKIEQMKQWLKSTGSPKSIITGADFKETQCDSYTLTPGFQIVK